jgi:HSP20 family molecular chaperone IbpA
MWNIQPLNEGQEVFLKRPVQIYAKVIGPRECDFGLPEEQVRYNVQLMSLQQDYLQEDLERAEWPQLEVARPDQPVSGRVENSAPFYESAPNATAANPFSDLAQEVNHLIENRAYGLYEQRGFAHGNDAEDWLRAESEILRNIPASIVETESDVIIRADLGEFNENDLQVRVSSRSVCISGKRQGLQIVREETPGSSHLRADRIFRVLDLPYDVDPSRAEALLDQGVLELKLSKVGLRTVVPIVRNASSRSATA